MRRKEFSALNIFMSNINQCINQIHFIGIGGAGMCGIAKVLVTAGYKVSGSDLILNNMIRELIKLGVKFFLTHQEKNIRGANIVVISSAIRLDNPEIIAAKKENIEIMHRAEMLNRLMQARSCGIAVAGTHGKSTTTAMIVSIYLFSGLNPTFVNGEIIKSLGTSAHLGNGKYCIVEADESDASFLLLYPVFEVITNIKADHMDTYQGDFEKLKQAFLKFIYNLPVYGTAVICLDDPVIRTLVPKIDRKIITYGFSEDADLCIVDYCQKVNKSSFILRRKNMSDLHLSINIPGRHNALNTAAATAIAIKSGIDDDSILRAMVQFCGINRRFEILGVYNLKYFGGQSGEVILMHDYGHHPIELNVTIETIRIGWPDKRLVMVFQPHRFTRTRDFYDDFVKVLSIVDVLLVLDVYSSGERFVSGADSVSLCATIRRYGKINPFLVSERILFNVLSLILRNNDFLLMQGAGTIGEMSYKLSNSKFIL